MSDALGLDRNMHEAYRVLVREQQCTAQQVAVQLGIARPDAEQTLERLTTVGLAAATPGEPTHVVPLDPQETIGATLAKKQAQLKAEQQELSRAREAVASLVAAYAGSDSQADPKDLSRGPGAVRARVEDLVARATANIVTIVDERARAIAFGVKPDIVETAIGRGVTVRVLHPRATLGDPQFIAQSRWVTTAGGLVRTGRALPPAMVVVDGSIALLPADGHGATALVVHNRPLSRALVMLFEQLWSEAGTSVVVPGAPSNGQETTQEPTQAETDLLRLLGKGMTDASAARQLGVSLRTVRRMMADLMGRLGARSRFEAGLRAAERGWLGPASAKQLRFGRPVERAPV